MPDVVFRCAKNIQGKGFAPAVHLADGLIKALVPNYREYRSEYFFFHYIGAGRELAQYGWGYGLDGLILFAAKGNSCTFIYRIIQQGRYSIEMFFIDDLGIATCIEFSAGFKEHCRCSLFIMPYKVFLKLLWD
ncbi:hypothetical protein D3C87_1648080 [compost metagenome]